MLFEDSFKKDWKNAMDEMKKKLGSEKATDTTLFDAWFKKVESRASSGIAKALKELDKYTPKNPKTPTNKEYDGFSEAYLKAKVACKTEVEAIVNLVKELKGGSGDKKLEDAKKDNCYRALKVFKAKIEHYMAAAQAQAGEYRMAVGKGGLEQITLIKHKCSKELTEVAVLIKQVLANPDDLKVRQAHNSLSHALETIEESLAEGPKKGAPKDYCDKGLQTITSQFQALSDIKLPPIDTKTKPLTPEAVKAAASSLGKIIKATMSAL